MTLPERIRGARRMLAEIETLEDALHVADIAESARVYARRAQLGLEAQNEAAEVKILAEREAGLILVRMRENGERAGRGDAQKSQRATFQLADLGVSKDESSRWQSLASFTEEELREEIERARRIGEITTAELLRRATRKTREDALRVRRGEAEEEARASGLSFQLEVADVCEWRPEGVASIVTDPPYVGDVIPLYSALADLALDVLPEGGPLVVMTSPAILVNVAKAMDRPGLPYRWCIEWRYANAPNTVDHAHRVFDCWKPVLVYHKGGMPKDAPIFRDSIESEGTDKDYHEWGQGLDGFRRLVASFSEPGETVCDPFLGGGTTAVAALSQARNFVGADVDAECVETVRGRLTNWEGSDD